MQVRLWAWTAAILATVQAVSDTQQDTVGVFVDAQGVTHIYGNSFGRPGYNETYDYIVVGGGNAGNTIAARLALNPANYTVAVLEAGSFYEILDGNRTQVPGYNYINTISFPLGSATTPTTWGLTTVPQKGYDNREIFYAGGQTFGGSSAANYMGYQRPSEGSMDQWAKEVGDNFWAWDNVYPAFKKSVHFTPPDFTKIDPSLNITYDPSAFSDKGGPLHVSYGNYQGPYGPSLSEALAKSGLSPIKGFNSGKLIGYGTATATAAARGSSIKIYPNALTTKILFDNKKKATGVEVQSNIATSDFKFHLNATKEIILSAGVWHSPQLLMLSGVGPSEKLQQFGIDVVADLPGVGQNEHDQPVVGTVLAVNVTTNTQLQAGNPESVASALSEYINHQSGPLSGIGTGQGIAFEKFPASYWANFSKSTRAYLDTYASDWPDVEILPLENGPVVSSIGPNDNLLTFAAQQYPRPSLISPNWLQEDEDVEQAYAAFLRLREVASNWDPAVLLGELSPGPQLTGKKEILEWMRKDMNMIFHGTSTCKMGPKKDTSAVVDSRARVHGVTGLRVVDASAFPFCPPGHPMSSVYMFAEKIAESILGGN
ncbi:hypothetical protein N7468_008705 [Penicillium chermesinum]|uniref:Uncharacterized protein n=1 Tax=Penicillium chermesinum TaxID=63820 RepID=A0A9W9TEC5_9EURO|nr:uncharacterized protein N7468_008705 [Penicillium chermesinum]KAJ5219501.1 hypothetical protein N7468_008705 [Penicillium chermesinum]